jgi:hypothetical protein
MDHRKRPFNPDRSPSSEDRSSRPRTDPCRQEVAVPEAFFFTSTKKKSAPSSKEDFLIKLQALHEEHPGLKAKELMQLIEGGPEYFEAQSWTVKEVKRLQEIDPTINPTLTQRGNRTTLILVSTDSIHRSPGFESPYARDLRKLKKEADEAWQKMMELTAHCDAQRLKHPAPSRSVFDLAIYYLDAGVPAINSKAPSIQTPEKPRASCTKETLEEEQATLESQIRDVLAKHMQHYPREQRANDGTVTLELKTWPAPFLLDPTRYSQPSRPAECRDFDFLPQELRPAYLPENLKVYCETVFHQWLVTKVAFETLMETFEDQMLSSDLGSKIRNMLDSLGRSGKQLRKELFEQ